ncbi:MAG: NUDIX domain-containing protein [Lachnospiraceae bacterium]|nr:NUDIX domain-containing protein [Lachnospiraceae bacterium]
MVFGEKKNGEYNDREGVYFIPIVDNRVAVVKTPKGYFFIGGGIEDGETDEACILRECLEETGRSARVGKFVGSAETYTEHPVLGLFHPIQRYYLGELLEAVDTPKEEDHELVWVEYGNLKGKMFAEMQNWALEEGIKNATDYTN